MILSVSRRTDIPAFYSDWFMNRIREGFVVTKNPFNPKQMHRISLNPHVIDCIVFWSKNPKAMINHLDELDSRGYKYYFQFTLNGYGKDIEPFVPAREEMIHTFKKISKKIGRHRVIWRYDPILINTRYDVTHHIHNFEYICKKLSGYTEKCIISFIDSYQKNKNNLKRAEVHFMADKEMTFLAQNLSHIAESNSMHLETCSEKINLDELNIQHGKCIDDKLIERIIGCAIKVSKDKNQRSDCGCVSSIDIGAYNSCKHRCIYCYANYSQQSMNDNIQKHHVKSPLLIGELDGSEVIKAKEMKSLRRHQMTIFEEVK
ncbi:DUF1848 domain-containing protein [Vallitalea okinawensis]|uniref:DUF1848 domain-containing protein n=1 Tax=Vallitalea okinawensis TaxID=2078660 RepID=UPI000CFD8078|nr:DUF1848 domain-containing protein [Vallitalea okinawensis]